MWLNDDLDAVPFKSFYSPPVCKSVHHAEPYGHFPV